MSQFNRRYCGSVTHASCRIELLRSKRGAVEQRKKCNETIANRSPRADSERAQGIDVSHAGSCVQDVVELQGHAQATHNDINTRVLAGCCCEDASWPPASWLPWMRWPIQSNVSFFRLLASWWSLCIDNANMEKDP